MKSSGPAWWQLYILVPAMFVMMALEQLFPLAGMPDSIVDAVLLIGTFALMLLWLSMNREALEVHVRGERGEASEHFKISIYEPLAGSKGQAKMSDTAGSWAVPNAEARMRRRGTAARSGERN